jgi:hypothetical protein
MPDDSQDMRDDVYTDVRKDLVGKWDITIYTLEKYKEIENENRVQIDYGITLSLLGSGLID